jgi:heptosyltransferase II
VFDFKKILVVQTAFLGDVVLALPLVQVLKEKIPAAVIDMLVIPRTSELLRNHPDINEILLFDKRGKDAGLKGLFRQARKLRERTYDIAFVPHRSLRSAAVVALARIPHRIGFQKNAGRFLFNSLVHYVQSCHEIERNLSLLGSIGITIDGKKYPRLYPSGEDKKIVDDFLSSHSKYDTKMLIAVAPGTVWNTKRWLEDRFIELVRKLAAVGFYVVLIGGNEDAEICKQIVKSVSSAQTFSAAGKLTLLQSTELIHRSRVLVCNDSAPMHLAVAVETPVVAIFGATVPEFGFAPYGRHDIVVETKGLSCRPCSIHGGDKCPITTFDCMKNISAETVYSKVLQVLEQIPATK